MKMFIFIYKTMDYFFIENLVVASQLVKCSM